MDACSRRTFLTAAALSAGTASLILPRAARAEDAKIRHAVIGLGGQGTRHARTLNGFPDCEIAALCDVDPERLAKVGERLPDAKLHDDFRRVLEDKSIDSVSIATPDHWHTPIALLALAAGKHVYVEKPCAQTLHEARVLRDAAARSGRVVQQGTQGRSGAALKDAVAFMQEGGLGKVRAAKAINHQLREPIGRAPESDPPPGVNYDLWLGPAPKRPFTANRWHYNWHWFWDYGSGDVGNDGIHQMDQARWGLGGGVPRSVTATGAQLFYDDDHETPDTMTAVFDYGDRHLIYEMRLWTNYSLEGHDNGVVFYGDKGRLDFGRKSCTATFTDGAKREFGPYGDFDAHQRNFMDCVKAGDPAGLNGGIAEGAVSTALCQLANIAHRTGRKLAVDPDTWEIAGDPEAMKLFTREYREGYGLPAV